MKKNLPAVIALVFSPLCSAINIQLDYTYDSLGFFSGSNASRRDVMEAAANVFEQRLSDELSAISNFNNGFSNFEFSTSIERPDTGVVIAGPSSIAADTVIVYVGGTNLLSSSTLGEAGPAAFSWSGSIAGGDQDLFDDWVDNITSRGQGDATRESTYNVQGQPSATDTALWGGTISFNNSSNWYFDPDPSTDESFNGNDFYSVALHEIGHVLGVGTADAWFNMIDFNLATFNGAQAIASQGGPVPLADAGHFASGLTSTVDGTSQEVSLDPDLLQNTRKRFTDLDWAALEDIGWEVEAPVEVPVEQVAVPTLDILHLVAFSLLSIALASRNLLPTIRI